VGALARGRQPEAQIPAMPT